MKVSIKNKPISYRITIFILLIVVMTVPLLVAGVVSYRIYMEEVTKQVDLSIEATQIQCMNDVESVLLGIKQYYLEMSNNEGITWLMDNETIPYNEYSYLNEAQKLLQGPTYLNGFIANYAFLNIKNEWVLTNNGMYKMSEIRNKEQVASFLDNVAANESTLYWQNNLDIPSPFEEKIFRSSTLDISGFQLVMKLPGVSNRMDYLVLIQLNIPNFNLRVQSNLATYDLCIIDNEGKALFTSDTKLKEYFGSNLDHIRGNSEIHEISIEEEDNSSSDYRVYVNYKNDNGLVYITAYNLNKVREGADRILAVSLQIILGIILIVIICWLLTSIIYRPVKKLTAYVSEALGKSEVKTNEFAYIRENVGDLIDTRQNLQKMIKKQESMLLEQLMVRTIRGDLTPESINSAIGQFHIKKARYYCLVSTLCLIDSETGNDNELENEALSITITKNLPSEVTDKLIVPPFTYREEIILLIGGDEEDTLYSKVLSINEKMAGFIEKEYGCSIISGASQLFNRFKYMRSAYNECREALRNTGSLKHNHQAITFFEDFAVNTGIISGYDYMIEKSLINAVNNGEAEEAAQQIDKFVNSLDNREIAFHDRNYFLHRIVDSVLAVLTDAGLSLNQIFSEKTDDSFWQISSIYESDKLKQYLNTQIVQPVIEALKQYRYNSSSDILKNVMDIVKETKGDITLAECAERLNYHPSYIWKVLKSERNMTFTDLTNSEKLETAKHMLLHTDYTVAEIAEQLNYSNTQNFIRFFSKFEQTTPGKYRKENRKQ